MNLRQALAELQSTFPALEARVLLAHSLAKPAAWLLAHLEDEFPPEKLPALQGAARRLAAGEPLPYILGHWEFYGLDFDVLPDVLIPRPETELLIETALAWAQTQIQPQQPLRCLDIGTGSGCIPITLATRLPNAGFTATDISPAALAIARQNAQKHGVGERIRFVEADLFGDSVFGDSVFDDSNIRISNTEYLITSNPPYIPTETLRGLEVYGREPTLALDGGPDGLALIRRLLAGLTANHWQPGLLLVEIENRQGAAVAALAREHLPAADITIQKDLAGHDRLLVVRST